MCVGSGAGVGSGSAHRSWVRTSLSNSLVSDLNLVGWNGIAGALPPQKSENATNQGLGTPASLLPIKYQK